MGPTADGGGDPNWLTTTLDTIGASSSRCSRPSSRRWCSPRSSPRSPTSAGHQRRPARLEDPPVVRDHRARLGGHRHRPRSALPARARTPPSASEAASRPGPPARWLDFLTGLSRQLPRPRCQHARAGDGARSPHLLQRAADRRHRPRRRHRRAQGRRGRRAVPQLQAVRARDRAEGPLVGHPPRSARHPGPHRPRRRDLRLGPAGPLGTFAAAIYVGLALVLFVVYPDPAGQRARGPQLLPGRLAGDPAGLRVAVLDRHAAGHPAGAERNLGVPR